MPTTVKKVKAGGFEYETGLPVPVMSRGAAATSELAEKLKNMPAGASFLEAVTVPETVKDADERDKVFKENARKVSNRLSGAIRRFKKNNPGYEFVLRTVNDDEQGRGVRVFRTASEAPSAEGGKA